MSLINYTAKTVVTNNDVTTFIAELPIYSSGARVYVIVHSWSNRTVSLTVGTTGWTNVINGTKISIWEKDVADSETNPSFDLSGLGKVSTVAIAVDDAGVTDISASITGSFTGTGFEDSLPVAVTTPSDECSSIFAVVGSDYRTNSFPTSYRSHSYAHSNFRRNIVVGSAYYPSSGVQQAVDILRSQSSSSTAYYVQIVIENAANGRVQGQADTTNPPSRVLATCGHVDSGSTNALITSLDGNTVVGTVDVNNRAALLMPYFGGSYFGFSMNSNDSESESSSAVPMVATIDLSDSLIAFSVGKDDYNNWDKFADSGGYFAVLNGSKVGATLWKIIASDTRFNTENDGKFPLIVKTSKTDDQYTFGTDDLTGATSMCLATTVASTSSGTDFSMSVPHQLNTLIMHGGNAYRSQNMEDAWETVQTLALNTVQKQIGLSSTQFFISQSIQWGNGVTQSTTDLTFQNIEFPSAPVDALDKTFQIDSGDLGFSFKEPAGGSFVMGAGVLDCGDFHTFGPAVGTHDSDIYNFQGRIVAKSTPDLGLFSNIVWSGIQFVSCKEIIHGGQSLAGVVISKSVDAQSVTITNQTDFEKLQNCSFSSNSALSILITGNHDTESWSASGMTISNGAGTYDIEYAGTGTLTINADVGAIDQARCTATGGGTIVIAAPQPTLTITGFPSGATVLIHDLDSADPQELGTELLRSENSTVDIAYVGSAGNTVSITMHEPNYKPFYEEYVIAATDATFTVKPILETN